MLLCTFIGAMKRECALQCVLWGTMRNHWLKIFARDPATGSHDQETYHQSRYKPKNTTDTPYHYKETGDQLYKQRKWKQAADAYSEVTEKGGGCSQWGACQPSGVGEELEGG